jgi:hypothetical protein
MNASVLQDLANSLMRSETLSGPSLEVYMEAVRTWREPLIKDLVGFAAPIQMQPDLANTVADRRPGERRDGDGGDFAWDDEPER